LNKLFKNPKEEKNWYFNCITKRSYEYIYKNI